MPLVRARLCQKDAVASMALRKPGGQSLRQPGRKYLALCLLDVIRDTMKCDGMPGSVIQREGGARIAIARLADRARIDQVLGRWSQRQLKLLATLRRLVSRRDDALVLLDVVNPVPALNVCMPEEGQRHARAAQDRVRIASGQHVLIFIPWRSMDALQVLQWRERALRQLTQEFQVAWRKLLTGPDRRQSGNGIEVIQPGDAGTRLVVIPADEDGAQAARSLRHLIWIGAVADDIAEIENAVMRRRSLQAGFQRLEVGVDIGNDKNAHKESFESVNQRVRTTCAAFSETPKRSEGSL